jgi:hypothetical protein
LHAANIHAVAEAPAANGEQSSSEQESNADAGVEDTAENVVLEEEIPT